MITVDSFKRPCGCRTPGECSHNLNIETDALEALVDSFAVAMKKKLKEKFIRDGYTGWDDPCNQDGIRESMIKHAIKEGDQCVDVANLAAMLWNFKQP